MSSKSIEEAVYNFIHWAHTAADARKHGIQNFHHLVLDCYKALGKPKTKLIHFPFWLAYFGGLCFDLLGFILHKKFAINSIRVKKFTQNTYFVGNNIKKTDFVPPVSLEEGLRRTIDYEFVKKVQGHC